MRQSAATGRKSATPDPGAVSPKLPAEAAKGYRLTWRDEFEGNSIDRDEWNLRTGERFASMNKAKN